MAVICCCHFIFGSIIPCKQHEKQQTSQKEKHLQECCQEIELTLREKAQIVKEARKANKYAKSFNSIFEKWKYNWRTNPNTRLSSNTGDSRKLEEYPMLLNMGKSVIPLLMEKLLDADNFFALVLYDDLQSETEYKVECSVSEQQRVKKNMKLWLKSLKE